MGQIARSLGTPKTFEFEGKSYKISPWTYDILARFEDYLETDALRNMKKMRPYLTDEEYKDLAHKTRQDLDSDRYTFGGEAIKEQLKSTSHLKVLTLFCLQIEHPQLDLNFFKEVEKEPEKFQELIELMFEANADPNVQDPK